MKLEYSANCVRMRLQVLRYGLLILLCETVSNYQFLHKQREVLQLRDMLIGKMNYLGVSNASLMHLQILLIQIEVWMVEDFLPISADSSCMASVFVFRRGSQIGKLECCRRLMFSTNWRKRIQTWKLLKTMQRQQGGRATGTGTVFQHFQAFVITIWQYRL